MKWLLLLFATITSPASGTVMLSADIRFDTEALCVAHLATLKPHMNDILSRALPAGTKFRDPRLECRIDNVGEPV